MRFRTIALLLTLIWVQFALRAEDLPRRYAITTLSANYLREQSDFTAELGNQLLMGTPVTILDTTSYWVKVQSPDPYTAWCVDLSLKELTEEELAVYIAAPKWICTADYSKVLAKPGKNSEVLSDLVLGDLLLDRDRSKGSWREVALPSGRIGYVHKKDVEKFSAWAEKTEASAENIIKTAKRFLGVPYFWGGTSIKGVDCSGLTRMTWFMNGILLPRNASQQAKIGEEVPLDALQPGDLLFFGKATEYDADGLIISKEKVTHVGIYIGEGRFIHASKYVRINSLNPDEEDWYELSGTLLKARRIEAPAEGIVPIVRSPYYFPQIGAGVSPK